MTVITLLTDFGLQDEYVGVMKGVILARHPAAVIVDISHGIPPGDLRGAALMLRSAYGYFPEGTVHAVVVDPGVGTDREILVLETAGHRFLAPDNGVLSAVLGASPPERMLRLTRSDLFLTAESRTFHGRDRFAPVAAFLAAGGDLATLGPGLDVSRIQKLALPVAGRTPGGDIEGEIDSVDRFGNLITNIPGEMLNPPADGPLQDVSVEVLNRIVHGVVETYGSVPKGALLTLIGSRGYLEVAVNGGSAAAVCGASPGDPIRVVRRRAD